MIDMNVKPKNPKKRKLIVWIPDETIAIQNIYDSNFEPFTSIIKKEKRKIHDMPKKMQNKS